MDIVNFLVNVYEFMFGFCNLNNFFVPNILCKKKKENPNTKPMAMNTNYFLTSFCTVTSTTACPICFVQNKLFKTEITKSRRK